MPHSEHTQLFRELQAKYRCTDCDLSRVRWCWKQEFKTMPRPYHARLSAQMLETWALYITQKSATISYPPRIAEFDDVILEPLLKRYSKLPAPSSAPPLPSVSIQHPSDTVNPMYYNYVHRDHPYLPSKRRSRHDDSCSSDYSPVKRRRKHSDNFSSSPISPSKNGSPAGPQKTLEDFKNWCKTDYRKEYGSGWDELFDMLRKDDIDLDSFDPKRRMKPHKLIRLCSSSTLKEAAAERLLRAHTRWTQTIKKNLFVKEKH